MTDHMNPVDKGIYDALVDSDDLTSLTAGGTASPSVYQWLAPEGQAAPYVVYFPQSPSVPKRTMGGTVYEDALYTVKGVTLGPSSASAGTIAAKIEDAMNVSLTITGYTHVRSEREQSVDFIEVSDGQRWNHRGGVYRVQARPN